MIRQGLAGILASSGLEVVAEAEDGLQAIAQARAHRPDLMTLDIAMPYARGIEVFVEVRRWCPDTRIVVFSGMTSRGLLAELDGAGADGIFSKAGSMDAFADALPRVMAGRRVIGEEVRAALEEAAELERLTTRERQIVSLVAGGMTNREIAERLGVSVKTVDNHRTNLMRKLGVNSVAGLISHALREGLLDHARET